MKRIFGLAAIALALFAVPSPACAAKVKVFVGATPVTVVKGGRVVTVAPAFNTAVIVKRGRAIVIR